MNATTHLQIVSKNSKPPAIISPHLQDLDENSRTGDGFRNDDDSNFDLDSVLDHKDHNSGEIINGSQNVREKNDDSDDSDSEFPSRSLPVSKILPPEARMARKTPSFTKPPVKVELVTALVVPVKKEKMKKEKPEKNEKPEKKPRAEKKKESPVPEVVPVEKKRKTVRDVLTPTESEKIAKDLKHQADALSKDNKHQESCRLYILSGLRYLFSYLKRDPTKETVQYLKQTVKMISWLLPNIKSTYLEEKGLAYLLYGYTSMRLSIMMKDNLRELAKTCHNSVDETKKWVDNAKYMLNVFDALEKSHLYSDSPFHTNFHACTLEDFMDYFEEKYARLGKI